MSMSCVSSVAYSRTSIVVTSRSSPRPPTAEPTAAAISSATCLVVDGCDRPAVTTMSCFMLWWVLLRYIARLFLLGLLLCFSG